MPLNIATLRNGLINMEEDVSDMSESIGKVITQYVSQITPFTTTLSSANIQFKNELRSVTDAKTQLPPIMSTYASKLAVGMLPAFAAVPPTVPIVVLDIFSAPQPKQVFAVNFATRVHSWFKTGTATNTVSGVVIPWS